MADLKTNYVDDKLDSSKNQLRKYQQIQNDDGTVSFIDVTEYTTTGTSFGALDVNNTNKAVNQLNADLSELNLKMDGNATYSTTEVNTQKKWINGKDIYRKVYNIARLQANTATNIDSSINTSTVQSIVHFEGCATDKNNALVPLPYHNGQQNAYDNYWYILSGGLYIVTMTMGEVSQATITIEYTKK